MIFVMEVLLSSEFSQRLEEFAELFPKVNSTTNDAILKDIDSKLSYFSAYLALPDLIFFQLCNISKYILGAC